MTDKIRIYRTDNQVELRAVADMLEAENVEAHLVGADAIGRPWGVVGIDVRPDMEIWIDQADSSKASLLVDQWTRQHHPERGAARQLPLQFSLKTALGLMTVVAIAAAISAASGANTLAAILFVFEVGVFLLVVGRWLNGPARQIGQAADDPTQDEETPEE